MATAVSSRSVGTDTVDTPRKSSVRKSQSKARKPSAPSEDDIRVLAYSLYEQRIADGSDGNAESDWIEAEFRLQVDAETTDRD